MAYNLLNQTFNRLTVVEEDLEKEEEHFKRTGFHMKFWKCRCSCGSGVMPSPSSTDLVGGHTQSCGCLQRERTSKAKKKYNKYDLKSEEYGIGYTLNGEKFLFDKEDYDKIKKHCWYRSSDKYILSRINKKLVCMHAYLLSYNSNYKIEADHINRDRSDNRKENLRIVNYTQNGINKTLQSNNTSGVTGVAWDKSRANWHVYIDYYNKRRNIGRYRDFNQAVYDRFKYEIMLFQEYSPHYNINNDCWELEYYDVGNDVYRRITYTEKEFTPIKIDVREVTYEELKAIPSNRGMGALGSSGK